MMIYKKRLKLLELIIFGFVLIIIGSKGHAAATTNSNIMPNPSNFSGSAAGNRVKLVVSKPYTNNSLNAPTSIVKIYSTSPNLNIDIYSFDHCNASSDKDSNTFAATQYRITTTGPATDNDTGVLATSARTNSQSCIHDYNTAYNITLPTNGYAPATTKSEVIGHTAYYVYVLRADMLGTGVNGFTVVVNNPNSLIGYSNDAGDNFAIQNRTLNASDTSTFNIPFAADCNTFTSSTTLFWQDDDWGGLQNNYTDFYFEVLDVTTGALAHLTSSSYNPAPSGIYRSIQTNVTRYKPDGGSGVQMRATITDFNPDHKYDWQWHGVVDANGIQFKLPYDSINFNTTCPNPFVKGTKISNLGTDVHESLINGTSAGIVYPFSDDRIEAHRTSDSALVHSALANPFNFRDCNPYLSGCRESSVAYDNHLPKNEYYFTSVDVKTIDTSWTYLGYTLCDTAYSSCNATYLNTELNIRKAGTSAYNVKLLSGHSYDSRFIYSKSTDLCPNIAGNQTIVPAGLTVNASGNCLACDGTTNPAAVCPVPSVGCFSPTTRAVALDRSAEAGWANSVTDGSVPAYTGPTPPNDGPRQATTQTRVTYTYAYSTVNLTSPDEYGDGAPTSYVESATNPANVDYAPYVASYPYDTHTPVVGYKVTYKKTVGTYTRTETATSNTYVGGTYNTYTYGSWTSTGSSSSDVTSAARTKSGPTMPPCSDRTFNLVPVANSAAFFVDPENPTSVTLVGNITPGSLAANNPAYATAIGLRDGLEVVNFPMNGVYYTRDLTDTIITPEIPFTFGNQTVTDNNSPALTYSAFNDTYSFSTSPGVISRPPLNYGDKICFLVRLPSAQGTMDRFGNITSTTGAAESATEACTGRVGDKPYFKAFGGDILAGGSFATNAVCGTPASPSVIGQYRFGVGGASSQLAAIALIKVSEVASASLRTAFPTEPNGLTFANVNTSTPISPPTFMGGQFDTIPGATGYCAPDYFTNEQFSEDNSKKVKLTSALNVNLQSRQDNEQTVVTPSSPTTRVKIMAPGMTNLRHTLFIDSDAEIIDDINTGNGPWGDPGSIPYLTIIVRGNLYIAPNVKNITGVFIAQQAPGRPNSGRIYTCTAWKDSGTPSIDSAVVGACRNSLTVTGAFIAQRVVLERTTGTLSNAPANGGTLEGPGSPNIGEIFQFSPEFYVSQPVFRAKPVMYDSIKGLPPIL